jgi:hypothetical protein
VKTMKNPERFEEDENEFYHDYKEDNVVFPNHGNTEPSVCITYNIKELSKC